MIPSKQFKSVYNARRRSKEDPNIKNNKQIINKNITNEINCKLTTKSPDKEEKMKLKSMCFSSMDEPDDEEDIKNCAPTKKPTKCCSKRSKQNLSPDKVCCPPHSCSNVINEYKQTRMTLLRERCDKNGVDKRIKNNYARKEIPPPAQNGLDENYRLNIVKLKSKFESSVIVRQSSVFSSTTSDSNSEKDDNVKSVSKKYVKKRSSKPLIRSENDSSSDNDNVFLINSPSSGASSLTVSEARSEEKYEERFEQSVEQMTETPDGLLGVEYRNKFPEIDVSAAEKLTSENVASRLTQLSTRSNSDSQLDRTSGDYCRSFKNSNSLEPFTEKNFRSNSCSSSGKLCRAVDVLKELIETERNYVESLRCIVEDYLPEMQRKDIVQGLRGQKFAVFCNIEKIYDFHRTNFLKDLKNCIADWTQIGTCFLKHEKTFDIYSLYNKNKPKSDELMVDYGHFFEEKRLFLGDCLNLSSLLLKPVQRLARYSLLLDKFLKESDVGSEYYQEIFKAKEMIVYTLRHGDDLLVMDGIKNCDVNLNEQGKLLRQEEFLLIEENGKKSSKRRLFLFEELILFSIPSKSHPSEFHCCNSMKMSDVGLTDYGDTTKFIIWFRKYQFQKYTLQAFSPEVKTAWVTEITKILMKQAEQYKYSMRSLRGVAGEIKPKKIIDRTTWYCTIRTEENEPNS